MIAQDKNKNIFIYCLLLITLILVSFNLKAEFRHAGLPVINKILHPEYYNHEFFHLDLKNYNPYFNHHYIAAYTAKLFNMEENLYFLGKIFWIVEHGIFIFLLLHLSKFLFKEQKLIYALIILIYLFYAPSGWAEPKFVAIPLMLISLLFFLKNRWILSAFFSAGMFYFHIGYAVWWYLASIFAIFWILIFQRNIFIKDVVKYIFFSILFALPMMYIYWGRMTDGNMDDFTVRYSFDALGGQASPVEFITRRTVDFINLSLQIILVFMGIRKAQKSQDYTKKNLIPIVFGFLALFVLQIISMDILKNPSFAKIQLMRAIFFLEEIFWVIFVSYILAKQVKDGRPLFSVIFVAILLGYKFKSLILGLDMYQALMIFNVGIIIYELFNRKVHNLLDMAKKKNKGVDNLIEILSFKKIIGRQQGIFQIHYLILLLALMTAILKLPEIKTGIKKFLGKVVIMKKGSYVNADEAYMATFNYLNKNVKDESTLMLFPYKRTYPFDYTHHDVFNISRETPIHNLFYNNEPSPQFKYIMENDLKCSIEQIFVTKEDRCQWDQLWKDLDEELVMYWHRKYQLTHVIRENEYPLNFTQVYQNNFFTVYKLN
ncbi:MAG: hypothetical protein KC733_07165 [Candidatus Omnitrophica bacterium]|nr:hypothetical protein [Candidatus Omnitrophota bacterium]